MHAGESANGRQIEMIVAVVRYEDEVDRGQVLEAQAWRREAPRTGERDGAGAVRPVGIGQDVDPVKLDQERRVPDPCDRGRSLVIAQRPAVVRDAYKVRRFGPERGEPDARECEFRPGSAPRSRELRIRIDEPAGSMVAWRVWRRIGRRAAPGAE